MKNNQFLVQKVSFWNETVSMQNVGNLSAFKPFALRILQNNLDVKERDIYKNVTTTSYTCEISETSRFLDSSNSDFTIRFKYLNNNNN